MLIIFVIMASFVIFGTLLVTAERVWQRRTSGILLLVALVGLIMFITTNPFAELQEPEIDKVTDLTILSEGDAITLNEENWQLVDNNITVENCYKITELPDNCIFLFIDESNKLYYVQEDKVTIVSLNSAGNVESESMYSYSSNIIRGEAEDIYAEKSVIRSKVTLWSFNDTILTEYTFYIPEDVVE